MLVSMNNLSCKLCVTRWQSSARVCRSCVCVDVLHFVLCAVVTDVIGLEASYHIILSSMQCYLIMFEWLQVRSVKEDG